MTIDSEEDIAALKRIGRVVALALKVMKENVRPSITTGELDNIGAAVLAAHGAHSAPQLAYHFPGATCISINNEAAHGIPGSRIVQPGDLVNLDVSAELDGYFGDTAITVAVPPVDAFRHNLVLCSERALQKAIAAARGGKRFSDVGRIIEKEAEGYGFTTLHDLGGHGVGRGIHEEPHNIANYYNPNDLRVFTPGQVLTIEPFITPHAHHVHTAADGWTLTTADGGLSAQCEHTLVITKGKPIITTLL